MIRALPLLIFLGAVGLLAILLYQPKDTTLTSPLIGKPLPAFNLPVLQEDASPLSNDALKGKVTLLNVFASWCVPCASEHKLLMQLKAEHNITIYGVAWKDTHEKIGAWLAARGNPYAAVAMDTDGSLTLPLGITGVPETYVINDEGVVVAKFAMPLDRDLINEKLLPLLKTLQHETP